MSGGPKEASEPKKARRARRAQGTRGISRKQRTRNAKGDALQRSGGASESALGEDQEPATGPASPGNPSRRKLPLQPVPRCRFNPTRLRPRLSTVQRPLAPRCRKRLWLKPSQR